MTNHVHQRNEPLPVRVMEMPKHATYPVWVPEWQAEREFQLMTFWGAASQGWEEGGRGRKRGGGSRGGEKGGGEEGDGKLTGQWRHFFSDTWRVQWAKERKTCSANLFAILQNNRKKTFHQHTSIKDVRFLAFPFKKKFSKSPASHWYQAAIHVFYPHSCK